LSTLRKAITRKITDIFWLSAFRTIRLFVIYCLFGPTLGWRVTIFFDTSGSSKVDFSLLAAQPMAAGNNAEFMGRCLSAAGSSLQPNA
jgi:hypothetical protein